MDVLTGTEGEHHAGGDGCRIIQTFGSGSGNIDSIIGQYRAVQEQGDKDETRKGCALNK